ncbi:hypothetical protein [Adhaeribacter rhizoryzae]|uniref:Uncharacterized protein n=1 Tax=Adhaeribacter rhizoryzae TaxID=2607907 RepID=A0A5M6CZ12_9BACT|nr:hypothetical protein [Adhaeribacter rhizoryzae]KAA5538539.1 hypothetical protein F0145_25980 [Adhaeribacter rhizoryzae]
MFGSQILEVAIGVIFVFLLVSIICSAIRESIEAWLKTRAAFLEHGIRELLHDKNAEGLAKSFYEHPLIYSLFAADYKPGNANKRPNAWTDGSHLPSYIPAKNFALALMDIATRGPATDFVSSDPNAPVISLASIRLNIENIQNPAVQRVLLTAIDAAQGDLNKAQANIEAWYDSGMDRVSGWYKRSTQWVIFWIGLFAAVALNINTITIADYLYHNDVARAVIVARAETAAQDTAFLSRNYSAARSELDSLVLPLGWSNGWGAPRPDYKVDASNFKVWNHVLAPLLGWLITALAATMGAPFWFDILNKVMVIRSTVKPHEKSPEEASEDRQMPRPPVAPAGIPPAAAVPSGGPPGNIPPPTGGLIPTPRDAESSLDGCHVVAEVLTLDEDLPAAEGGVA